LRDWRGGGEGGENEKKILTKEGKRNSIHTKTFKKE